MAKKKSTPTLTGLTQELPHPEPLEDSKPNLHEYQGTYLEVLRILGSRSQRRDIIKKGKIISRMVKNVLHIAVYNNDGKVVLNAQSSYEVGEVYKGKTIAKITSTLIKDKSTAGYFFTYILD
jgi:hypothetical protein